MRIYAILKFQTGSDVIESYGYTTNEKEAQKIVDTYDAKFEMYETELYYFKLHKINSNGLFNRRKQNVHNKSN